ncbi:MAG: thermonuclease family protein [Gammaproteobacteria bacterium]|nr:thermonuclease family protein [Gammaproteobacteria bacterium]
MIKRVLGGALAVAIVAGLILHYTPGNVLHAWLGWSPGAAAYQPSCTGPVQQVIDGDTVWMRCNGKRVKVRLDYIDAPEVAHPYWHKPGQPGGTQARSALISLIAGHFVTLTSTGEDDYGRTLGVLRVNSRNLNLAMVRQGWAWAYRGFTNETYTEAQQSARAARRGLWAFPPGRREPPWRFRHRHD